MAGRGFLDRLWFSFSPAEGAPSGVLRIQRVPGLLGLDGGGGGDSGLVGAGWVRCYALYMAGEKRKEEEVAELQDPVEKGRVKNPELPRGPRSRENARARNGSFHGVLAGVEPKRAFLWMVAFGGILGG